MTIDRNAHEEMFEPIAFAPGVRGDDGVAQYWLRQVTLRLRREVCWLWRERALQEATGQAAAALPPFVDRPVVALDLMRYVGEKGTFFTNDVTARYLSECIAVPPPLRGSHQRGSFGWVVERLALTPVECFVLALGLLPTIDSACGDVIATCQNDPQRSEPTLALAQRLWDDPDALLHCFDPAHPLLGHGLLTLASGHSPGIWHAPLYMAPMVAHELLFPGRELPAALEAVSKVAPPQATAASLGVRISAALNLDGTAAIRILPVIGESGAVLAEVVASCTERLSVVTVRPSPRCAREHVAQLLTTAWLRGHAVYLPVEWLVDASGHDRAVAAPSLPGLPLLVFVGLHERAALGRLGGDILPPVTVSPLSYSERLQIWRRALPSAPKSALAEVARRFRYEHAAIARVGAELAALGRAPAEDELFAAAHADLEVGTLAQAVAPRFALSDLMLPAAQARQVDEIVAAMRNLTRVHYEWGTAGAWNEGGLAALFAGPPGTGKTMCAEAMATALKLPLYRIDLSQVVNKYIGETEKNLRKLFDAADAADVILFFDEADALFGKRTEVKDAHDRYANLEISYLLERMERFKGLAILATNRKKDLDEAFLRRLRFVVEFPLPGPEERLRIWRSVIPEGVDVSTLDFNFLAHRFALAGGHIRAMVFHACLQSGSEGAPRELTMPAIIRAVQREYEKLERTNSLDQFGPYAPLVAAEMRAR
jgi:vesicle-fusing ATPase